VGALFKAIMGDIYSRGVQLYTGLGRGHGLLAACDMRSGMGVSTSWLDPEAPSVAFPGRTVWQFVCSIFWFSVKVLLVNWRFRLSGYVS
jgi:hypothetical protein